MRIHPDVSGTDCCTSPRISMVSQVATPTSESSRFYVGLAKLNWKSIAHNMFGTASTVPRPVYEHCAPASASAPRGTT